MVFMVKKHNMNIMHFWNITLILQIIFKFETDIILNSQYKKKKNSNKVSVCLLGTVILLLYDEDIIITWKYTIIIGN